MAKKKRKIILRLLKWVCGAVMAALLFGAIDFAVDVYLWEGTSYPGIPAPAASHMEAGRWEDALDELLYLLDQGKKHPNIKYYIAQCYKNIGVTSFKEDRYDDALADFEDGLWYDEDDLDLQLCLAATCLTVSKYDRAETVYENVITLEPDNALALKKLGEIYYLRNDLENTEIVWSQALAIDPDDAVLEKKLLKLRKEFSVSDDFDTDEDLHFSIVYDGESTPQLGHDVLEILDDAYYDIALKLKLHPKRQVSVTLLTKEAFFDITESPQWSSGWYEGQIKIPAANAEADALREILVHEYVHAVIFDHVGHNCPWWLNEGLAQYLSKTDSDIINILDSNPDNSLSLNEITRFTHGALNSMDRDEASHAYAASLSAVSFLFDDYGETILQEIIESMSEGKTFNASFEIATGGTFEGFETEWREAMR
jgi:tetratricopeptide (TPR) repeat protein